MTKTKNYKLGKNTFKTYFKPVGKGFEIGFTYKNRNYFTSNFVNKTEATKWWSFFNKEITSFSKKHWLSNNMPFVWFCNFLNNHLYKTYYSWLDKVFNKHEENFHNAYKKDYKKFLKLKDAPTMKSPYFRKVG
ncbi:MAG: hypothetical protein ACK41T_05510 [Pseudobdellovibrio sp.]